MSIRRKEIRDILNNDQLDADAREKALLDLVHGEMDGLRDEIDDLNGKLTAAQADLEKANTGKSEAEKALNDYKDAETKKATRQAKLDAVKAYYESKNIKGKNLDIAVRGTSLDELEMSDGKLKDTSSLDELVGGVFSTLVSTTHQRGADVDNPPNNGGESVTKEKFAKMGYRERLEIYNNQPELYNELMKEG